MNKHFKTALCLLLVIVFGLFAAACGEEEYSEYESQKDPLASSPQGQTAPEPAPEPAPELAPAPAMTKETFFGNAAFIGDSVTLKLRNYNAQTKILGDTTFLCQGSYSVDHAVNNTMLLSYQGEDLSPQDALAACGADRVFILLGMNDIGLWGVDKTIENYGKLIANIREKNPGIDIYIQSGTPIYPAGERGKLTNANMNAYNERLQEFAADNGCYFVNVNNPFKDQSGGLAKKYCSDEYVHFTDAACELWAKILIQLV